MHRASAPCDDVAIWCRTSNARGSRPHFPPVRGYAAVDPRDLSLAAFGKARIIAEPSPCRSAEPTETGGFLARTDDGDAVEVSRQSARDLRKRLGLPR